MNTNSMNQVSSALMSIALSTGMMFGQVATPKRV